jgi:hypothetical protein
MFIPDSILIFFHPVSRIQIQEKSEGGKETCCPIFFIAISLNLKLFYFRNRYRKSCETNDRGLKYVLLKKFILNHKKYGQKIRDPRSGQKTYPDPGSATLNDSTRTAEIQFNKSIEHMAKAHFLYFSYTKNLNTVKTAQDKN